MENILDLVGFFGPVILMATSVIKLSNQKSYLVGYLVFYFINDAINQICKVIVKEERPKNTKSIIGEPYVGADKYGMPSRHAESMLFSTTYLFLVKGSVPILLVESFICALTLYQRLKYRQHTAEQLIVGSLMGMVIAFAGYYLTNNYILSNV